MSGDWAVPAGHGDAHWDKPRGTCPEGQAHRDKPIGTSP